MNFVTNIKLNYHVYHCAERLFAIKGPNRNQLNAVARILEELQQCKCFYCDKDLKQGNFVVDHFIPWSMYPSDTGHNFVLADSGCNSKKSNFLASERFLDRWRLRNEEHNLSIIIGYRNWDF